MAFGSCWWWGILPLDQLMVNWRKSSANSSMWNGVSHIWDSQLVWFLVFHCFGNVGVLSQEKGLFFTYYFFFSSIRIIYFPIFCESCLFYCYQLLIQRRKNKFHDVVRISICPVVRPAKQNFLLYCIFLFLGMQLWRTSPIQNIWAVKNSNS